MMPSQPLVNVSRAPGVPAVNFAPGANNLALLTADTYTPFYQPPAWGIYLGGAPVVIADTVGGFDYRQEWAISDYPVEEGSFESYDKVAIPFEGRFRFVAGGSVDNRAAMLASIDAIAGDTNLYDIVTPEDVYTSVSIKHYDYNRTAERGVGLLVVDVYAEQVIVVVPGMFGPTAAPSGASPQDGGTVQATAPTASQSAAVGSGGAGGDGVSFVPGT